MRKFLITVVLLSSSFLSYSQSGSKNIFGINLGVGKANIVSPALDGGPSIRGNTSFQIGFDYYRKIDDKLMFESGIVWYVSRVTFTPHIHPGMDRASTTYGVDLLYVPLFFRRNLSKYFFFRGGLTTALDLSKESPFTNQTGLGSGISLGGELPVSGNLILQIIPYLNLHGLFVFDNQPHKERIFDGGVKMGLRMR